MGGFEGYRRQRDLGVCRGVFGEGTEPGPVLETRAAEGGLVVEWRTGRSRECSRAFKGPWRRIPRRKLGKEAED